MATLQNLMDDTRTKLADLEDLAYTDAMLTTFANEGQKKMAESLCCQRTNVITGFNGQSLNIGNGGDLSKEAILILWVKADGVKYDFSTVKEWGDWDEAATTYVVFEDNVTFKNSLTSASLQVAYVYTPDNLAGGSDVSDIPDKYAYGVVAWMEYRCRSLDREGGLAERAYNEYVEAKAFAAVTNQSNINTGGYAK